VIFGEIRWVDLPDRSGREQRGRRPAIIWQDTAAFRSLPTVIVVPLTSRMAALRFPAVVRIVPSLSNGLATESAALVFQLGACDLRRVREKLGVPDASDLQTIRGTAKRLQKIR